MLGVSMLLAKSSSSHMLRALWVLEGPSLSELYLLSQASQSSPRCCPVSKGARGSHVSSSGGWGVSGMLLRDATASAKGVGH